MTSSSDMFCATVARAVGAQLFGTAPEADVWILLEYTGTWGREAFAESDLPTEVKVHLDQAIKAIPKARLQLIKQDPPYDLPDITLAVAICREVDPALYVFEFDECEKVTSLDIVDVVANENAYVGNRSGDPMVLICTNAKRDQCCALRGLPVYSELAKSMGTTVWRTTHLGGHRFGATGVVLPYGIVYGRIDDIDLSVFIEDVRANRLHLPALRGRSRYSTAAQTAEFFLLEELQISEIGTYRLIGADVVGEGQWNVRFAESDGQVEHVIGVRQMQTDKAVIPSCGKEPEKAVEHQLVYHRTVVSE